VLPCRQERLDISFTEATTSYLFFIIFSLLSGERKKEDCLTACHDDTLAPQVTEILGNRAIDWTIIQIWRTHIKYEITIEALISRTYGFGSCCVVVLYILSDKMGPSLSDAGFYY
jgi:hypothetical protein